jgi:hypothetical protein
MQIFSELRENFWEVGIGVFQHSIWCPVLDRPNKVVCDILYRKPLLQNRANAANRTIFVYRFIISPILRKLLAANIKVRRSELGLTQEKLAEMVDLSYQMLHDIEGCRTWVSDKTRIVPSYDRTASQNNEVRYRSPSG